MHEEMNKQQAADYLNISTRTFDRYIESGKLPQGIHVRGSKNLIWYKDELI
jgi:excisionase family DNA binding protein